MQSKQNPNTNEGTVDIFGLLQLLLKRSWIIAAATAVCCIVALLYSVILITPTYRSGFTTYINNRNTPQSTGSTSVSDLSASMGLAYVYAEVIVARPVLTEAAQKCGLTYSQLAGMVETTVSENAPVISVFVEATDPTQAANLAQAIADTAPAHVKEVVEGSSMKIIEPPIVASSPYAPNHTRNALIGALVGFLLSAAVIITVEMIHDKVDKPEELEERYQITVLGSIPDTLAAEKQDSHYGGYGKTRGEAR